MTRKGTGVSLAILALACSLVSPCAPVAKNVDAATKKTKVSVKLSSKKFSLKEGETGKLKVKVTPSKAKLKWKSSKKKVATVSSKGKITAKKSGTTVITVRASYKSVKKSASCKVKVTKKAAVKQVSTPTTMPTSAPTTQPNVTVTPTAVPTMVREIVTEKEEYVIEIGKTCALNASVLPENATNKSLLYVSESAEVATVDANGVVQAVKEGLANITITAADNPVMKKTVKVRVVYGLTTLSQETKIRMNVGETCTFAPNIEPADATLVSVKMENTKDYVAEISEDGSVTAKYPGIAFVTVSSYVNPEIKSTFRIEVGDDFTPPEGFDKDDDSIEHGTLKDIKYPSDYRPAGKGNARIWLPPDYDEEKQYNLLFCLHGGGGNEKYWTDDHGGKNDGCSADKVLDHAYADGLMEDTIVVFTNGVIAYDKDKEYPDIVKNPRVTDFWKDYYLLEFDILNCLLPYMEYTYPVMTGSEHTGICGLSMGCAQTMEIAFKNPEYFGYVGCYSAGPFEPASQNFVKSKEDAQKLNDSFKYMLFATGENDHMNDDSMRNFIATCDSFDLSHTFYEVPACGHDDPCWDRCLYAFMKYAFK